MLVYLRYVRNKRGLTASCNANSLTLVCLVLQYTSHFSLSRIKRCKWWKARWTSSDKKKTQRSSSMRIETSRMYGRLFIPAAICTPSGVPIPMNLSSLIINGHTFLSFTKHTCRAPRDTGGLYAAAHASAADTTKSLIYGHIYCFILLLWLCKIYINKKRNYPA